MQDNRRGRPPKALDPDASQAARLGAELRARRNAQGLTLRGLAERIGFSPQHISSAELAKAPVSGPFVAACDHALNADGALVRLLPAVIQEQAMLRHERSIARSGVPAALRFAAPHSEVGADVEPTNRRGLLGAGAATALGGLGAAAAVPAAARDIDPELATHWTQLLGLLGRHDAVFGSRGMLGPARHQLDLIAEHRQVARGQLRAQLLRVEARWAGFAAWLSSDTGQVRSRNSWADHALRLARESGYEDMAVLVRSRQSQWALQELDARQAVRFAEDGLRMPAASVQTRALCTSWAALGHALAQDTTACERMLDTAHGLVGSAGSSAPAWAGDFPITPAYVHAAEARCWLWLQPSKSISLYDKLLLDWPRDRMRTGGLHQARLALACTAAGERDRATAEGRKALAIARATKSSLVTRELNRLGQTLGAANA